MEIRNTVAVPVDIPTGRIYKRKTRKSCFYIGMLLLFVGVLPIYFSLSAYSHQLSKTEGWGKNHPFTEIERRKLSEIKQDTKQMVFIGGCCILVSAVLLVIFIKSPYEYLSETTEGYEFRGYR